MRAPFALFAVFYGLGIVFLALVFCVSDLALHLKELQILGLEHHHPQKSIKASILQSGKKYVSLLGIHHCSYEGFTDIISSYGTISQSMMVSLYIERERGTFESVKQGLG